MIHEKLLHYQETKQMVSFCKWQDGDGILVGYVMGVSNSEVRFDLVNPLGKVDEESTLVPISSITRLEETPDYMQRLIFFGKIVPPIVESKGQTTRSQIIIAKRLREAALTGECVSLYFLGEVRSDFRVLRTDNHFCEIEEFGDDPLKPLDYRVVNINQIDTMRWRSSDELVVTALWRQRLASRKD